MIKNIICFLLLFLNSAIALADDINQRKPTNPRDNDILIKEYMSSKDTSYIHLMLEAYNEADDVTLKDARRFAYLYRQFNNTKSPRPNMAKTAATAACAKYKCNPPSSEYTKFTTISSGMWALDSISQKDAKVKETVVAFLKNNERMRKIYELEGAEYSDYTVLVVANSVKPGELDKILTSYESFGTLDRQAAAKILDMKKAVP